jgi:hypothetical protein
MADVKERSAYRVQNHDVKTMLNQVSTDPCVLIGLPQSISPVKRGTPPV